MVIAMKITYKRLLVLLLAVFLAASPVLPVCGLESASRSPQAPAPTAAPGQEIFEAAPTIPESAGSGSVSVLGIVLWVLVLVALLLGLSYMILNFIRYRNFEKQRKTHLVKPTLIISEAGHKFKNR